MKSLKEFFENLHYQLEALKSPNYRKHIIKGHYVEAWAPYYVADRQYVGGTEFDVYPYRTETALDYSIFE